MGDVGYTIRFAALVSVVASLLVAGSATVLEDRQQANRLLDRQRRVLEVAALVDPGERLSRDDVTRRFEESLRPRVVDLATGDVAPDADPGAFDQRAASRDPDDSRSAPENDAGITRIPLRALVYQVVRDGGVDALILPIEGKGLWGTMYGYLAIADDLATVEGITFYEHLETPGLGSGIEDPSWQARWRGRRLFDDAGTARIEVIKGPAPGPLEAPYHVDGLSGATLTGRGVTALVRFWLGPEGFGPYLTRAREGGL